MPDRQTELRLMLRSLRMPAIAAQFEDLALKAAKGNLTHEAFLYELVRAECIGSRACYASRGCHPRKPSARSSSRRSRH